MRSAISPLTAKLTAIMAQKKAKDRLKIMKRSTIDHTNDETFVQKQHYSQSTNSDEEGEEEEEGEGDENTRQQQRVGRKAKEGRGDIMKTCYLLNHKEERDVKSGINGTDFK